MNIITDTLRLRREADEASARLPALMAAAEKAAASILHGEHSQKKSGSGEKFWQFREYVPGDRLQDIDWRQSAKTDRIHIRQKEWQTTQTTVFWCYSGTGMNFSSDARIRKKGTTAKILTLALAILMTRAGEQVGLFGLGKAGRSETTLQNMAQALYHDNDSFKNLPDPAHVRLPPHCSLIQIGDFLNPLEETRAAFKKLSSLTGNGLVIQVLDPAEIELPYSGRCIFEPPQNTGRVQINHVDSIRDEYKKRIHDHMENMKDICRRHSWNYILHRTDTPLHDTLAQIWANMSHNQLLSGALRA